MRGYRSISCGGDEVSGGVTKRVTLDNFGMLEESPQLSTSGSARLLDIIQSNKLLLLAAM